ncbi:MAG: UDP-N-acetylmuramoyl-L-alanyl-D-glutamate--2,6-diaminopimelate ligase [Balneolaceae bacterium]
MTITDLITYCNPIAHTRGTAPLTGVLRDDSRTVEPGDLFIAIKGHAADGHDFIPQAVQRGASVIITEKEVETTGDHITWLQVSSTRELAGPLAHQLLGNPAQQLHMIGVTGTNGKTTVATLIWQALTKLGKAASLLGTVEKRVLTEKVESRLTTSGPAELALDIASMAKAGSGYLVMEVSSHALDQHRTAGIPFSTAIFTNLSLDHLDYHRTMDAYAEAKKRLFNGLSKHATAITNVSDPYGRFMISDTNAQLHRTGFVHDGDDDAAAIEILSSDETGMVLRVGADTIETPLIGRFNAMNVAQAFLALRSLGFTPSQAASALAASSGAPGRLERVTAGDTAYRQPVVLVDYAHTPDALKNVLKTLKGFKKPGQQLIVVFGCGGDRDTSKRPAMAAIAELYADEIVVTSDNPRTEDPEQIIDDIFAGFKEPKKIRSITSRRDAIREAIRIADAGDIVLIAGKGHETYQEINGERHHFDDREEARKALSNRNGNHAGVA